MIPDHAALAALARRLADEGADAEEIAHLVKRLVAVTAVLFLPLPPAR